MSNERTSESKSQVHFDNTQLGDVSIRDVVGRDKFENNTLIQVIFAAIGVDEPSDKQRKLIQEYLNKLALRLDKLEPLTRSKKEWQKFDIPLSEIYVQMSSIEAQLYFEQDAAAVLEIIEAQELEEATPQERRKIISVRSILNDTVILEDQWRDVIKKF